MTPQEKDLIQNVFDRLARTGPGAKDAEAENLIRANVARLPDADYGLVQAVVMLEAGLSQAQARIADLQRQLEQTKPAGGPLAGGSFLSSASPWGGASVPPSAAAPQAAAGYASYPAQAPAAGPWAQSGGGGFLRNAATMAAGVAGGTLIAEGLSSLLGGHGYGSMGGGLGGGLAGGYGGPGEVVENVTVNNYYDNQNAGSGGDDSVQDASFDSSDDAGFDSSYDDSADI